MANEMFKEWEKQLAEFNKRTDKIAGEGKDGQLVVDSLEEHGDIHAFFVLPYEDVTKLDIEQFKVWCDVINDQEYNVEQIGFAVGCFLPVADDPKELEAHYEQCKKDRAAHIAPCEINIDADFDGDFGAVLMAVNEFSDCMKDSFELIMATDYITDPKTIENNAFKALRRLDRAEVVAVNPIGGHSHATGSSNRTDYGTYDIKIYIPKMSCVWFDLNTDFIYNTLRSANCTVAKPKGSIYSSITGATPLDVLEAIKAGHYQVEPEYLTVKGLKYEDLFVGD